MPRLYTVAEVEADPVRLNSRLGTYTNFVNLLDLAAIACPSGMRGDGLPSSLTLIGPSGADGYLAGLAAEIQARSGVPMGATGLAVPPPAPMPAAPPAGRIALAVVGAHLAGLPLNPELVALGGRVLARGRDDGRLPALRVAWLQAAETRPPAGDGRSRAPRSGSSSGLSTRRASEPSSPGFPPRSASGRFGLPTDQAPRAFWSRRRRSRAPRTSRRSADGEPTSAPAEVNRVSAQSIAYGSSGSGALAHKCGIIPLTQVIESGMSGGHRRSPPWKLANANAHPKPG